MALADRYHFDFVTLLDSESISITIQQEGYTGSVEVLPFMPGRDFLKLGYDKTNSNLLWPIRGAQLTLKISLQPSEIAEFVLSENRDWFIIVTGSGGFEWRGWYQPQTSVTYSPYGLREIVLQFSDNLGALQNTPDNILAQFFIEKQSFETMVTRLLGYTDISLPIVYDNSITHTDFSTLPVQEIAYLDQTMTLDILGQLPQSAYDILSKLLRMMQSVLYQKNGNWVIENWIDKKDATTPVDLLADYKVVGRGLNIRFESPLSKTTGKSHHYQIRHTQQNRDFSSYIPSGPNKGFEAWEQFGLLGHEMFDLITISGKNWFKVIGNYVSTIQDSRDYYENLGGNVTQGENVVVYFNYEYTPSLGFDVNAQFAVLLSETGTGTPYYLRDDLIWDQTATPFLISGDTAISGVVNVATVAPVSGVLTLRVYRPDVPSLGSTYNFTNTYVRVAYAEVLASKVSNPVDYKLFKSVATKQRKGLRNSESFETIGLQYDTEFSPNEAAFFEFDDFISFIYDNAGLRINSKFYSGYEPNEKSLTQFATNTYMRLFAKTQIFVEAELYGKGLNVGDIYSLDIPGFSTPYVFVCVAFDWDVKSDFYSAIFAYIDYDATDTITQSRFWIQQNQDDPQKD